MIVKKKATWREWVESALVAFIMVMIIRTFIVQAFKIPTGSMEPTLHGDPKYGDHVLVNKYLYSLREPKRGEIVVFRTLNIEGLDWKKDYIKRLIGLPGDTIEIKEGRVYVNGQVLDEPSVFKMIHYENIDSEYGFLEAGGGYGYKGQKFVVPDHHYFVLGDNSAHSFDSRRWGFVPEENLMGKAMLIYWPLNRLRLFK